MVSQASALIPVLQALLSVRKCIFSDQSSRSRNCFSLKRLHDGQRGRSEHTRSRSLYCRRFHKYSTYTKIGLHASDLCVCMCTSLQARTCTAYHFHSYSVTLGTLATSYLSLTFCVAGLYFASFETYASQQYHHLGFGGLLKLRPSSIVSQLKTVYQLRLLPKKDLL